MADNRRSTGAFGLVLAGIVALAAIIFLITGGELGGKKTVESDSDMPPLTTGQAPPQR